MKYILLLWLTFLIEKGGMMQEIHDVNMLHGNSPSNSKNITMRYKRYKTNDIERKHNRIDKVKIMQQERSHFSKTYAPDSNELFHRMIQGRLKNYEHKTDQGYLRNENLKHFKILNRNNSNKLNLGRKHRKYRKHRHLAYVLPVFKSVNGRFALNTHLISLLMKINKKFLMRHQRKGNAIQRLTDARHRHLKIKTAPEIYNVSEMKGVLGRNNVRKTNYQKQISTQRNFNKSSSDTYDWFNGKVWKKRAYWSNDHQRFVARPQHRRAFNTARYIYRNSKNNRNPISYYDYSSNKRPYDYSWTTKNAVTGINGREFSTGYHNQANFKVFADQMAAARTAINKNIVNTQENFNLVPNNNLFVDYRNSNSQSATNRMYQDNNSTNRMYQDNNSTNRMYQDNKANNRMNQDNNSTNRMYQDNNTNNRMYQDNNSTNRMYQDNNSNNRMYQDNNSTNRMYQDNNSINRMNQDNNSTNRMYQDNNSTNRMYQDNNSTNRMYQDNKANDRMYQDNNSTNRMYQDNNSTNRMYQTNNSTNKMYQDNNANNNRTTINSDVYNFTNNSNLQVWYQNSTPFQNYENKLMPNNYKQTQIDPNYLQYPFSLVDNITAAKNTVIFNTSNTNVIHNTVNSNQQSGFMPDRNTNNKPHPLYHIYNDVLRRNKFHRHDKKLLSWNYRMFLDGFFKHVAKITHNPAFWNKTAQEVISRNKIMATRRKGHVKYGAVVGVPIFRPKNLNINNKLPAFYKSVLPSNNNTQDKIWFPSFISYKNIKCKNKAICKPRGNNTICIPQENNTICNPRVNNTRKDVLLGRLVSEDGVVEDQDDAQDEGEITENDFSPSELVQV